MSGDHTQRSSGGGHEESVLTSDTPCDEDLVNRTRCCVPLSCYGSPIDRFETKLQLLAAFRDAVAGHRNLLKVGVLHRDINIQNIILEDAADEGNRGLLIDMDLAIFPSRGRSNALADFRTGIRAHQAINVLGERGTHNYLDDLESFYYVLCCICFSFTGPGKKVDTFSRILVNWEDVDAIRAENFKRVFMFQDEPTDPPTAYFGHSIHKLLSRLHHFFWIRRERWRLKLVFPWTAVSSHSFEALPGDDLWPDIDGDYDEYLGILDNAIEQLRVESVET